VSLTPRELSTVRRVVMYAELVAQVLDAKGIVGDVPTHAAALEAVAIMKRECSASLREHPNEWEKILDELEAEIEAVAAHRPADQSA
jgi:hypothetical protein